MARGPRSPPPKAGIVCECQCYYLAVMFSIECLVFVVRISLFLFYLTHPFVVNDVCDVNDSGLVNRITQMTPVTWPSFFYEAHYSYDDTV